ncbi:MAG: PKD domain-containing protein, partial [Planctomycetota bacterium]
MFKSMMNLMIGVARTRKPRKTNPPTLRFAALEPLENRMLLSGTLMLEGADPASVNEGETVLLVGMFDDLDAIEAHTVTIDWGDGSSDDVNLDPGEDSFSHEHTYAEGPFAASITATAVDPAGNTNSNSLDVTINNVSPRIESITISPTSINEGETVDVSGTFSDPGSLDTHVGEAVWSDGVSTSVIVDSTNGTFSTSRTVADDNPTSTPSDFLIVTITITDDDGDADSATSPTVVVNNVAPTITGFVSDATWENKGAENEPVTITGVFTDPGVLDTHTATVDWGDGTTSDVTAHAGAITGTHTYTEGGIYTITVTLTDDDTGSTSAETTAVVSGLRVVDGVLWVIGTNDVGPDGEGDRVHIHQVGHDRLMVHADFIAEPSRTFLLSEISENTVIAYLCEGNDHLTMSGRTELTSIVHGGDGDDKLQGGRGLNALLGDSGDDKLLGKRGADLLIGGAGQDKLLGQKGQDILIGGIVDDDSNEGIMDVLNAWVQDDTFDNRVDAVKELLDVTDDEEADKLN